MIRRVPPSSVCAYPHGPRPNSVWGTPRRRDLWRAQSARTHTLAGRGIHGAAQVHNPAHTSAPAHAVHGRPQTRGRTSPAHTPKPSHRSATPRVYAPPYVCDGRTALYRTKSEGGWGFKIRRRYGRATATDWRTDLAHSRRAARAAKRARGSEASVA